MNVKELIERLQNYPNDAQVYFYDFNCGKDMYFKDIAVTTDFTEVYIDIRR